MVSSDDFPDHELAEQTSRKSIEQRLADALMRQYSFKTLRDSEDMLYYHDQKGSYVTGGERLIKEFCQSTKPDIKTNRVQEVINNINRRTGLDRKQLDENLYSLNLQNGVLDL
jgi:D5-like protein